MTAESRKLRDEIERLLQIVRVLRSCDNCRWMWESDQRHCKCCDRDHSEWEIDPKLLEEKG